VVARKKLGQMLIDENLLTEEQLSKALAEQQRAGLKLGQYLIRHGFVSEQQLVDVLGRQLKLRKYHPDIFPFNIELSKLIPIEYAQKYQIAPLVRKGRLLTIAITDPLDINALDVIEMLTNCEVEAVVCAERELNQLISSLYGIQSGLGGVLESIDISPAREGKG
jgi:type IV pilus assembly protein PilB